MKSFSSTQSFLSCPKKYFWSYVRKLVPTSTAAPLIWGRDFHEGLEGVGHGLASEIGKLAANFYPPLAKKEVKIERDGMVFIADGITSEGHVVEYKTTSRANADYVSALSISPQLALYAWAFGTDTVILRVIKKPTIRQTQKETEEQFHARALALYPGDNFLEVRLKVTEDQKKDALAEFKQTVLMIQSSELTNCFPRCHASCYTFGPCAYLKLCEDFDTYRQLYKEKEEYVDEPVDLD